MIITLDPMYPPHSIIALCKALFVHDKGVAIRVYQHSSVVMKNDLEFSPGDTYSHKAPVETCILFIWKLDQFQPKLVDNRGTNVVGEINILRHFGRLLESYRNPVLQYEKLGAEKSTYVDYWLDCAFVHFASNKRTSFLKEFVGKWNKNSERDLSIADLYLWSLIKQFNISQTLTLEAKDWFNMCVQLYQ